jgi:2-polyprenyl-3-methyl-5-hydroxy-6-metoxy-1,4-benzoquinol methylase
MSSAREIPVAETVRFLTEWLPPPPARVVDVGCGDGGIAASLAILGYEVQALDSDPAAVRSARERGVDAQASTWLDFVPSDHAALLFIRVLHHAGDSSRTLGHAFDVLPAGGSVLVEDFAFGEMPDSARIRLERGRSSRRSQRPWVSARSLARRIPRGFENQMDSYDPDRSFAAADWLELDEGERIELVSSYHRRKKVRLPNIQHHAVIHVIAENQLALGEKVVLETFARLQAEGLSRHDALHAIGSVLAEDLYELLHEQSDAAGDARLRYLERLQTLSANNWRAG